MEKKYHKDSSLLSPLSCMRTTGRVSQEGQARHAWIFNWSHPTLEGFSVGNHCRLFIDIWAPASEKQVSHKKGLRHEFPVPYWDLAHQLFL